MVEKGTSSKMPNQLGDTTGNLKRKRNASVSESSTSRDETPVTPSSPPPQINPIHQAAGSGNRFQDNLAGLYVHIHDVIYTYEAKIEAIEAELTATKERIMNLESTSENLRSECEDYKKALKTAQAEIEVLRNFAMTEVTAAKERIMSLECTSEKFRSECEDYKKDLKTAQDEIEVLRNSAFKAELIAAKERITNLERTSEDLRSECEDYKKALETSQAEIEVFRNSVAHDPCPVQVHMHDPNLVASENEAAEAGNPEDGSPGPYTSPSKYDLSSAPRTIGHVCLEKGHQEHEKMPHTICGSPKKRHHVQEKLPHSTNGKCGKKKDGSRTTTILYSYGSERRELLRKNLDFLASNEPCNADNVEKNSVLLHSTSPQVSRSQSLNPVAENDQEVVSTRAHLQSIDEWLLSSKAFFYDGRLPPEVYREKVSPTSKLHISQQNAPQHHPNDESPSQGNTSQHTDSNCKGSLTNGSGGHEEVNELTICQTERKTGRSSRGTDSSSRGVKSPGSQKSVAENNQEGVSTRARMQSINEWLFSSKAFHDSMLFPEVYRKKMITTSELPVSQENTPQHHPSAESPSQGNTSQLTNGNCIESLRNGPGGDEVNELMLSVCQTERTTVKGPKGTDSTSVGLKSPESQKPVAENNQEGVLTRAHVQSIDVLKKMTATSTLPTSQRNTPQHHPSAESPSQGNTSQHTDSNCKGSLTNGSGGHEEVNELTICQTERKTGRSSRGTDSSSQGVKSPVSQKPVSENNQEGVSMMARMQSINEWFFSSKAFHDNMLFPEVYRKMMITTSELPVSQKNTPQHHPSAEFPSQGNTSQLTTGNCIESLRNGPGGDEEVNELMLSVCQTERTTVKGSKGTDSTSVGVKSPESQKPVAENNQEGVLTRARVKSIDKLKKMTATSTLPTSQRNTPQNHPSAESPSQGNTCQHTNSNCIESLRDGSGGHEEVNELMLPICQTERKTRKSFQGTASSSVGVKSPGSQKLVAENNQEGVSTRAHLQYIDDWLRLSKAFHEGTLFPEVYRKKMTTSSKLPISQRDTPQHHPSSESPPQGNTSQHTNSDCIEILRNGSGGLEEVNELMMSIRQKKGKTSKRRDSSSLGVKSSVAEKNQEGVQSIDEWLLFSKAFHGATLFPEVYSKKMTTTSKPPKSQRNTPQHLPSAESPSHGNTSQHTNTNCMQSLRDGSDGNEEVNEVMLSIRQTERKTGKSSKGTASSSPRSPNRMV